MTETAGKLAVPLGPFLKRVTFFPSDGQKAQQRFDTTSVKPANRYTVFFNADNNQQTSSTLPTKGVEPLNVPPGTK